MQAQAAEIQKLGQDADQRHDSQSRTGNRWRSRHSSGCSPFATFGPGARKAAVSVIAFFCVLGIALGVATLIIVLSVMNGFRKELFDKILGLNGHVIVRPLARPFNDFVDTADRLNAVPGVKFSLPVVEGQVMVSSQSNSSGIIVRGLRAKDLDSLKAISGNIRYGSLANFDQSGGHRHRNAARQFAECLCGRRGNGARAARGIDAVRHRATREAVSDNGDFRNGHVRI